MFTWVTRVTQVTGKWGGRAVPHGAGAVTADGGDCRSERDFASGAQPEDGGTLCWPGVGRAPGRCDGAADKLALLLCGCSLRGRARGGLDGRTAGLVWRNAQ